MQPDPTTNAQPQIQAPGPGAEDASRTFLEQAEAFGRSAVEIWMSGGWAMIAIAATALLMFGMGIHIHNQLRRSGHGSVREKTWRRWIDHPDERRGPIGRMLDSLGAADSIEATADRFSELRSTTIAPIERDLKVMRIFVSAAPLLGLLGTVTGMLATFAALSAGSGGDKTMNMVAGGISEALVTTETGLVVALPGLFFQYQLTRRQERLKAFMAHVETVFMQRMYTRDVPPTPQKIAA